MCFFFPFFVAFLPPLPLTALLFLFFFISFCLLVLFYFYFIFWIFFYLLRSLKTPSLHPSPHWHARDISSTGIPADCHRIFCLRPSIRRSARLITIAPNNQHVMMLMMMTMRILDDITARPCQSLLPGIVVDVADQRRPFGVGHLAGHLVVWASKPGRIAKADGHLAGMSSDWRPTPGLLWWDAQLTQSSSSRRGFTSGLHI